MPTYRLIDQRTIDAADPAALVEELRLAAAGAVPAGSIFEPGGSAADFIHRSAERATPLVGGLVVRDASVEAWYADMKKRGVIAEVGEFKPPDFERGVMVILATFAAFTGFTISGYLKILPDIGYPADWRWWGFFALVALLLRYILGSAVHLNRIYVGKSVTRPVRGWSVEREAPRSQSIALIFKDLVFLVIFGMLAVYIQQAAEKRDVDVFILRSMWFLEAGLLWSISDYFIRRCIRCGARWWWHGVPMDAVFGVVFLGLVVWQLWVLDAGTKIGLAMAIVIVGLALEQLDRRGALAIPQNVHHNPEWPPEFWRTWVWLDGLQFLGARLILLMPSEPAARKAAALALWFVVFLYADFRALIKAAQRPDP